MKIKQIDQKLVRFFQKSYMPLARFAFFVIFFWFGFIKLLEISPASPLAEDLVANTIGSQYFDQLFIILALLECLIGILFLIPKAVRITIPLLLVHLLIVCSPLLLLPEASWQSFLVPTLEGQYIIKNIALVALAFGVAANTKPIKF